MKNQILSNTARNYFNYKNRYKHPFFSKEGKMRFDLVEGLWTDNKNSNLPDRNHTEIKQTLAKFLSLKEKNISVFAGADEVIEIIPRLFLNQGDTATVVVPVFERLISSNIKVGAKVLLFNLSEINKFRLENKQTNDLVRKVKKHDAKLIWLCSPNNPTGQIIELKFVKKIAKSLPHSIIAVNEVYQEYFSFNTKDSSVNLIKNIPNIVVIRSLSKAFGLAGVRIGYVVSNPELISYFENFRTMYNLSTFAQEVAVSVYSQSKLQDIRNLIERISQERERLTKHIKMLSNYKIVEGSKTNFLFLKHTEKDIYNELYENGISVGDWRMAAGVENRGYIRVSVNKPRLNNRLISKLEVIN